MWQNLKLKKWEKKSQSSNCGIAQNSKYDKTQNVTKL